MNPAIEGLEDRIVLSTITWDSTDHPTGGSWDTASNRVGGVVPTSTEDAVIDLTSTGTVTLSTGVTNTVNERHDQCEHESQHRQRYAIYRHGIHDRRRTDGVVTGGTLTGGATATLTVDGHHLDRRDDVGDGHDHRQRHDGPGHDSQQLQRVAGWADAE